MKIKRQRTYNSTNSRPTSNLTGSQTKVLVASTEPRMNHKAMQLTSPNQPRICIQ